MSRYSDYTLQALSYNPMAYWEMNGSYKEFSQAEAFNSLTKYDTIASSRPLVFGCDNDSTIMSSASIVSLPMPACCPIGKPGKEKREWTINFWYQHLSDSFSIDKPIFSVGSDIQLFFSGQKFYLNVLGKSVYVSVNSYKELFHISIINNQSGGTLVVNDYVSQSSGSSSGSFSNNSEMKFQAGLSTYYQISNVSMYARELSVSEISNLRSRNVYMDSYEDVSAKYRSHKIGNSFYPSDIIYQSSPSPDSIETRNCRFDENGFYLNSKSLASVSGCSFSETSGASFALSGRISVNSPEIDSSDTEITIYSDFSSEGTLVYLDSYEPIEISVDSEGNLVITKSGSEVFNSEILNSDSLSVVFSSNRLIVNCDGSYVDSGAGIDFSYPPEIMIIGNNSNLSNYYQGSIKKVSVNYYLEPIPVGKYTLDFMYDYGSSSRIKPHQAGVSLWSVPLPYDFNTTSVEFMKSNNQSFIKTHTNLDEVDSRFWYRGEVGTNIFPGTSAKRYAYYNSYAILNASFDSYLELNAAFEDYDQISDVSTSVPPENEDEMVIVYFTVLLIDEEYGSGSFVKSSPGIKNLSFYSYSSNEIYSSNSIFSMTSADQDAFIVSEKNSFNSKKYIQGFRVYTDSNIVIGNLPDDITQISAKVMMDQSPSPTSSPVPIVSVGENVIYANKYISYFTLSASSGATIYVNGIEYSGQNLNIHEEYLISFTFTQGDFETMVLSNLSGFIINSIDMFTSVLDSSAQLEIFQSVNSVPSVQVFDTKASLIKTDYVPVVTNIQGYFLFSG